jgi:hypothetical protein
MRKERSPCLCIVRSLVYYTGMATCQANCGF